MAKFDCIVLLLSCALWSTASAFSVGSSTSSRLQAYSRGRSYLQSAIDDKDEKGLFPLDTDALDKNAYDLVVVGSGNGACGFLSHYFDSIGKRRVRVLVVERGKNYFFTSDLTHQNEWTKSYAEGNIFKLHNTHDRKGRPILSGGACTMGGGGSINYTMIHEASSWLVKQLGLNEEYWDNLKKRLNAKFQREDPTIDETPITSHIIKVAEAQGFNSPKSCSRIENIPNESDTDEKQLYQFPTQFNTFGQRTNSGVSIVPWEDDRLRLETCVQVEDLEFGDDGLCVSVIIKFLDTNKEKTISLTESGKVIICAGAASPRLLMGQKEFDGNQEIGKHVNDHYAMPLGIYVKPKDIPLSPKDIYGPVFATMQYKTPSEGPVIVSIDFFTGRLQKLLYLTSHLYLAFLLPNFAKNCIWTRPKLFSLTKFIVRTIVSILNVLITAVERVAATLGASDPDLEYITAIIKYNPAVEGQYETSSDKRITLGWFEDDQDKDIAKKMIEDQVLPLLNGLGKQPRPTIRCLYRLVTKVPYETSQIEPYIENYSKNSMLSEQHLAGGCLIGRALESKGLQTGLVNGSKNVHVADLSAVPLPRVSPQMTAYLVGFHVANQLYPVATST